MWTKSLCWLALACNVAAVYASHAASIAVETLRLVGFAALFLTGPLLAAAALLFLSPIARRAPSAAASFD